QVAALDLGQVALQQIVGPAQGAVAHERGVGSIVAPVEEGLGGDVAELLEVTLDAGFQGIRLRLHGGHFGGVLGAELLELVGGGAQVGVRPAGGGWRSSSCSPSRTGARSDSV